MIDLTPDDFTKAGYSKHHSSLKNADYLLQKTVRDEDGNKAYFINVWVYDTRGFPFVKDDYSYFAEVTFFEEHGEEPRSITVQTSNPTSIGDMEAFYARMYKVFGEVPDIHNN